MICTAMKRSLQQKNAEGIHPAAIVKPCFRDSYAGITRIRFMGHALVSANLSR